MTDITITTTRHNGHIVGHRPSLFFDDVWHVVALPNVTLGQVERVIEGFAARRYPSEEAYAAGAPDEQLGVATSLDEAITLFNT